MTRAIQAVPRSRLSSEMEHRWGGKTAEKCKNCVPSGGIQRGRRPVASATAQQHHLHLQPGQGKGRLGVILAWRHSHLSQYGMHSSFQLLNTFFPPHSPPSPLAIARAWIQPGELGNCPYPQALGTGESHQQRDKASTCRCWELGREAGKQWLNTSGIEFQSCFFTGLVQGGK